METKTPSENPSVMPIDERLALYILISQYDPAHFDELHANLTLWAKHGFSFGLDEHDKLVLIEPIPSET